MTMAASQTSEWTGFRDEALPSGVPIELNLDSDDSSLASFSYTLMDAGASILRVVPSESAWTKQIAHLAELSDDWDGENAPAPTFGQISTAMQFAESHAWKGTPLPSRFI